MWYIPPPRCSFSSGCAAAAALGVTSHTFQQYKAKNEKVNNHLHLKHYLSCCSGLPTSFYRIENILFKMLWMFSFLPLVARLQHVTVNLLFYSGGCSCLKGKWSLTVPDKLFLSAPALGSCWGHWEPKDCSLWCIIRESTLNFMFSACFSQPAAPKRVRIGMDPQSPISNCFCGRFISDLYVYTELAPGLNHAFIWRMVWCTSALVCGVVLNM